MRTLKSGQALKLRLVSSVTTAECSWVAAWLDSSNAPDQTRGATDGQTPVTVVSDPTPDFRTIRHVDFVNGDTVDVTVILEVDDGTPIEIARVTLNPGRSADLLNCMKYFSRAQGEQEASAVATVGTIVKMTAPKGYFTGATAITHDEPTLLPENIKKDVEILDVVGEYEGSSGSSGILLRTDAAESFRAGDDYAEAAGVARTSPWQDNGDNTVLNKPYMLEYLKNPRRVIPGGYGAIANYPKGYWSDQLGTVTVGEYVSMAFPTWAANLDMTYHAIWKNASTYYLCTNANDASARKPGVDLLWATYWKKYDNWSEGSAYLLSDKAWYWGGTNTLYRCKLAHTASDRMPGSSVGWASYWDLVADWANEATHLLNGYTDYSGTLYKCLLGYSANDREPGVATGWATKWANRSFSAWAGETAYASGAYASNGGSYYKASGTANSYSRKPGTGEGWASYWDGCNYEIGWYSSVEYASGRFMYHGSAFYKAKSLHTSTADDEPGVGVNWETYWDLLTVAEWARDTAYTATTSYATESGSLYQCSQSHSSSYREPGVDSDWATYWDLLTTAAWLRGTPYSGNDYVTNGGALYQCTSGHTATRGEPYVDADWETYWSAQSPSMWEEDTSYTITTSVVQGYDSNFYVCSQSHLSSAHEPTMSSDWETYWEVSTAVEAEWAFGASYTSTTSKVLGDDGKIYVCILTHTASFDDIPVQGVNWATYWELESDPAWVEDTLYTATTVVKQGSYWYECKVEHTASYHRPEVSTDWEDFWEVNVPPVTAGVYVCQTEHSAIDTHIPGDEGETYWLLYSPTNWIRTQWSRAVGNVNGVTWNDAIDNAVALTTNGKDDWHIQNLFEALALRELPTMANLTPTGYDNAGSGIKHRWRSMTEWTSSTVKAATTTAYQITLPAAAGNDAVSVVTGAKTAQKVSNLPIAFHICRVATEVPTPVNMEPANGHTFVYWIEQCGKDEANGAYWLSSTNVWTNGLFFMWYVDNYFYVGPSTSAAWYRSPYNNPTGAYTNLGAYPTPVPVGFNAEP